MLVWFDRPTTIILPKEQLEWLRLGKKWIEHWTPNLCILRKGINTQSKLLAKKPYKLDENWSPQNLAQSAATLLYYGAENPYEAIPFIAQFIHINALAIDVQNGIALYQIFPFTYYIYLPEPIPPMDYLGGDPVLNVSELYRYPISRTFRKKLDEGGLYTYLGIAFYYISNEEMRVETAKQFEVARHVIQNFTVNYPDCFLTQICYGIALRMNWQGIFPRFHRYYPIYQQLINFLAISKNVIF